MKAQFVYEAIKHLSPKSEDEIMRTFNQLSPSGKLKMYSEMNIKLSDKEIEKLIGDMKPSALAKFALEYSKVDLYEKALKKGHEITASDKKKIIANQRYHDKYDKSRYPDWSKIINKYIQKGRKRLEERSAVENKKDYDNARNKLNNLKDRGLKDITSEKQEKNGTMMFRVVKREKGFNNKYYLAHYEFSITKVGYVRRHWVGSHAPGSAPIMENPYLTYSEMADILINYVIKNEYIK